MADRAEPKDLQGIAANATATAEPGRVFVSYASPDAAVAGDLVESLERHGIACWIAPRDVKAGALYADAIVRAISAAKALVLVLSESAIGSSHVGKEVERASSKKRPIIALRIDNAPLTPALEYFLSESQWVEAQAENKESAYARLIDSIREGERTASEIGPATTPSADTATAAHSKGRRNQILLAAGGILFVVALAAVLTDKFWLAKQVVPDQLPAKVIPATLPTTVAMSDKSIAVLPFTDLSEKKDQEYFADGMAEEILDLLAKIPGLTVIGRTSSFEFKGRNEDLRTIGTKLNAAYVLEGSVRKSGEQLRITAQLINTRTGAHEWSETYDPRIGDVLKLQDAIAAAVVRELQLTVESGVLNSRTVLKSAEAYDLMLRGRHSADRWDKDGLNEAQSLLRQALQLDPTSAEAIAEQAYTFVEQGEAGYLLPAQAFERARDAAEASVKMDPKNVLAHLVLGRVHLTYDWDWAAAEKEFRYVSTLAPGNADALLGEALLAMTFGRWDDAATQVKAALIRDPLNPKTLYTLAEIEMRRGQFPESENAARRVLDIRPTFPWTHWLLGIVALKRGDRDGALGEMLKEPTDDGRLYGLAIVYHSLGRKSESDAALAQMVKMHSDGNASGIAQVYAYRGQYDEAMLWLERAYAQKDPFLGYVKAEIEPLMPTGDPRFKAFLRKMNLPE
jgi:TolB-like protein/Flp pilus assembly protein TadD